MNDVDPNKLQKRLDEIAALSKQKADIERKLALLTGFLVEKTPAPAGFDYKTAVLGVFVENPRDTFSIDDVTRIISTQHKFSADRQAVSNRLNYLTDRETKLFRVPGRRGIYQLVSENSEEEDEGVRVPTSEEIDNAGDQVAQDEIDRQRGK